MIGDVAAVITTALGSAIWIGARRERSALSEQIRHLTGNVLPPSLATRDVAEMRSVPPPVTRYLSWALPPHCRLRLVRLIQRGMLRADVRRDRWLSFEAEHMAAPESVGFLWNARVSVAPFVHMRVRDALIGGQGSGNVSLLSAVTVGKAAGTTAMNSGSLHRFLAEAVWYPTALLPSNQLQWSPIDENRALATLTDHGVSVSLEFRFAPTGEVLGIYTPARWGKFGSGYRQAPWEGRFRDYQQRDGIFVPTQGEVAWYVRDKWRTVWQGTITAFQAVRTC
jgi:hypothetical protein